MRILALVFFGVIACPVFSHAESDAVSFRQQVLPLLSRLGCSSGACHGSPHGKGGFRLSLRASDSTLDMQTLTRESMGHRVSPLNPDASLLLRKPLMKVSHGGGRRLRESDHEYKILYNWIAAGCRVDDSDDAELTSLEILPASGKVLRFPKTTQQLSVQVNLADGSKRDVTRFAVFESSDESIATVSNSGLITGHRRGEVAIIVRYLEFIETTALTFVRDVDGFVWRNPPTHNYVDELVYRKLKQLQFEPGELCNDSEFVRRVHLDVIGTLPTVETVREFLADESKDKRAKLIDRLLAKKEHAQFWTVRWGDLLRMSQKQVGTDGLHKYHSWVQAAIEENKPYNQFVRELLTASGNTLENPAANYYRTEASLEDAVETTAQTFLGVRIQCAKCHNHPYEKWTQNNYYGLSAFFSQVKRQRIEKVDPKNKKKKKIEIAIKTEGKGEVRHPASGQLMKPWVPGVASFAVAENSDRRQAFADWLTKSGNPFLAKVEVNRIWSYVMGRGIVEPFDDFRESNPPSNESLLEALARDFSKHNFDRKHILRVILNSRTYQATSHATNFNSDDNRLFSHYQPRRLSAEQMLDAISHVTDIPEKFGGHPDGTKATQLIAPDLANNDFLKQFGQPERQIACACERATDPSLPQALAMYNGRLIQNKLTNTKNRFYRAITDKRPLAEIVDELYLAALSRRPTNDESKIAIDYVSKSQNQGKACEDLCWAVMNQTEFLFQH
jgi:hypothetical protein